MPEVMVKGTKIHFLEKKAQAPDPKGKVVFIHGSGGNAGLWQRVMDGLAGEYHLLALDLPGHGRSEGLGMKRVSEYRDFLKDFLNALGLERIVLGGHSLGGAVVQDFTIYYPATLRAILLIGTGARLRVLPEALEVTRQMAEGKIEPRFDPWGFSAKASPEVLAAGEGEWAKTSPRVRYHDLMACDQFDIMKEIEKIRLPALMVCGREDRLTPIKYSEFLNSKIPDSKMEIIEGAGHMLMLEAPEALSGAILSFLRSLDSLRADY
ncbi:MAG: alpha/beta hydrolase [Deltaproteobacteria bacterium]|nr:alpha/beta hydrolase [Deltaproteobacteria bacterium]